MASPEEIRIIVSTILDEQEERLRAREEMIIEQAVKASFALMGVNAHDEKEVRDLKADVIHNHMWRKRVEKGQEVATKTVISTVVLGVLGALWMGLADKIKLLSLIPH